MKNMQSGGIEVGTAVTTATTFGIVCNCYCLDLGHANPGSPTPDGQQCDQPRANLEAPFAADSYCGSSSNRMRLAAPSMSSYWPERSDHRNTPRPPPPSTRLAPSRY